MLFANLLAYYRSSEDIETNCITNWPTQKNKLQRITIFLHEISSSTWLFNQKRPFFCSLHKCCPPACLAGSKNKCPQRLFNWVQ